LLFEILLLNRLFPNNAVNRRYRCLDMNYDESAEVEQPAAAALLVSRRRFHVCCGFDESFYPLWFEDVDLCKRLRSDGGKILYWPKVTFRHVGGHSIDSISFREKQVYWYRNMLYYVRKHFSWAEGITIRFAIVLGMALRILAEFLGLGKKLSDRRLTLRESVSAYLSVAKLSLLDWK
jgi:N-acetylglucosaminyl-diphospho-decaprenol L-rhamnosyltransferase